MQCSEVDSQCSEMASDQSVGITSIAKQGQSEVVGTRGSAHKTDAHGTGGSTHETDSTGGSTHETDSTGGSTHETGSTGGSTHETDSTGSTQDENMPLLDKKITIEILENENYKFSQHTFVSILTKVFYFLCILTGQYVNFHFKSKCKSITILIAVLIAFPLNFSLNVYALSFDIYAIHWCEFSQYCGFIYNKNVSHGLGLTPPNLTQFDDWKKAVITTATISGLLSYLFMAWVLYGHYTRYGKLLRCSADPVSCLVDKCDCFEPKYRKDYRELSKSHYNDFVISPFIDEEYQVARNLDKLKTDNQRYLSSLFTPQQCIHFQLVFWLNFGVFLASIGMLTWILIRHFDTDNKTLEGIDLAGLIAQIISQFSALMSCFIFSKVAYAISNRCYDFTRCIFLVANMNIENEEENEESDEWKDLKIRLGLNINYTNRVDHLTVLKKIDQRYTQILKNTLSPFGAWFAIHWVLYTLTAFMAIAYVADEIIMELYGPESYVKKCRWEEDLDCRLSLVYTILFALNHCILFLYPCFRAASVTKARKNMINCVSKARWEHIDPGEKEAFVTYLKDQNASFKISILCARLTFGFELAYFSIVVGGFGVVMKLTF